MKIADFTSLFIAHRVAAVIYLLHGRWKKMFKNVLLLEINFYLSCVRGNFMKVKYIYVRENSYTGHTFCDSFFMLMKTVPT